MSDRKHEPEPPFVPKPGQVDFTHIRYAPVINVVVEHQDMLLVVKRAPGMRLYPGKWNWIGGFLDDDQSIEDKAREELGEELGLKHKDIKELRAGRPFLVDDPDYTKTWLIVPVLARVTTDKVTLDWEAIKAGWFEPEDLPTLDLVPNALEVAAEFFPKLFPR
jgi:8-oxo-dGTP pyrophosphatase MutT (NUDIX family)